VVGHGHRVHAQGLDPLDQPVDADGPVEQRVLGVQVQVHESG
jgi:hypothetical protein